MCLEFALKKGGLSIIRNFIQSTAGIQTALPLAVRNRNKIGYKLKTYKDGKIINLINVESIEEAFPAKGDKK